MREGDQLDLGRLFELQVEAANLAERLTAAQSGPEARFTGRDTDRVVEVVVDGHGRVDEIRLDRGWQDRIGSSGLGRAVVSATANAMTARTVAWAERMDAPVANRTINRTDLQRPPKVPGDPSSAEAIGTAREIFGVLERLESQLDSLNETLERQMTQEIVVRSGDRGVTVTVRGGVVAAVDLDLRWLAATYPTQIAASIKEALGSALDRAASAATEAMVGFAALGEARTLTERPDHLLRTLGLLG